MNSKTSEINPIVCQKARLSRDARFDGLFFTAVKTTGIYCRSICPATAPKESNVSYYQTAIEAASAGFRPCLRCRPDSAPHSAAWQGTQSLLNRAIRLIDQGALENQSMAEFSTYLGISDRYLRQVFIDHLGIAPKPYALYQQCMFAKQLIHQTRLPINQIAFASGFNSVRRFNDCFIKLIKLTPSEIRRKSIDANTDGLKIKLFYRPPYDWHSMQQFLSHRQIPGLETVTDNSYGRSFSTDGIQGHFVAKHLSAEHAFEVTIQMSQLINLKPIINNIRRILDLDADTAVIESHLKQSMPCNLKIKKGLRLPGIWSPYEAGVRAILGQQVSVQAAQQMLNKVIDHLGSESDGVKFFPVPENIASSQLTFLKMPGARKNCLKQFAQYISIQFNESKSKEFNPSDVNIDHWLTIKGVGPWTVNYSKMRGQSDPDVYLAGDSGINRAIAKFEDDTQQFNPESAAPWRSYLTFQLWSQT